MTEEEFLQLMQQNTSDTGNVDILSNLVSPNTVSGLPTESNVLADAVPQKKQFKFTGEKLPYSLRGLSGPLLEQLQAAIHGYGEGILPGAAKNIANPISAGIGTAELKLRGEDAPTSEIFSDLYGQLQNQSNEIQGEHPVGYYGSELAGMMSPNSIFNKLFGLGKVDKSADIAKQMMQYFGKGAVAGGGTEAIKNIQELINPQTSLEALGDVAGNAVSTGAISSVAGPLGEYLIKQTAKPKGAEAFLKEIKPYIDGEKPMPKKLFDEMMAKYGDTPAVARKLNKLATKQTASAIRPMTNDLAGVTAQEINKASVGLPPEEKVFVKLLNRFAIKKVGKNAPKTVEEIQALKQEFVKDASKYAQREINSAAKDDILKAITKKYGGKAAKEVAKAYDEYSAMSNLQEVLATNSAGNYLRVEKTLKNVNELIKDAPKLVKNLSAKTKVDLQKLSNILTEYSNAGIKDIKIPGKSGRTLRGILEEVTSLRSGQESLLGTLGKEAALRGAEGVGYGIKNGLRGLPSLIQDELKRLKDQQNNGK